MAEEIEIKLALPPSLHTSLHTTRSALLHHPLLAAATKLGTRKLSNVYFDTPDFVLHKQAIALRTRKQGREWLQTVKCARSDDADTKNMSVGGLAVRPEWEQPYRGTFDFWGIDNEKVRSLLMRPKVHAALTPLFETTFSRSTWRLTPAQGTTVLLMLDQGSIQANGATEVISEVELELEHGETAHLFGLAMTLCADLPLQPAVLSKAERGFRLYSGAALAPVKAVGSTVHRDQTPWEAFRTIIGDCLQQLQLNELGAEEDDIEFIHQMRVALRRLRAALRTFAQIVPPEFMAVALPRIRTLARALGHARDRDVLLGEILAPVRRALPQEARVAALCAAMEAESQAMRDHARAALASTEHAQLLLSFAALLHAQKSDVGAEPILQFAAGRLNKLNKKLHKLAQAAEQLDVVALHALRIGGKRLRYAIEFFAPLYLNKDAKRTQAALVAVQNSLGALNDLASAGAPLMQCAGNDATLREAVTLIGGWHGPRYEALRAELPRQIREVIMMKRFWRHSRPI